MRSMRWIVPALAVTLSFAVRAGAEPRSMTADDIAALRNVSSVEVSPGGERVAFVKVVPRTPCEDEDGAAWAELWVAGPKDRIRPFVTGEVDVGAIAWTPDGTGISFLAKRGKDEHTALYVIPVDGGEARRVVAHDEDITDYTWSPDGSRVAFLAKAKLPKTEDKLEKKGFKAEIFEEQWRPVRVWIAKPGEEDAEPKTLEIAGSASEVHWSPVGDRLAVALAPTSLVDDHYMRRKVHVVDAESGKIVVRLDNPGKLGAVEWSPDGKLLAMISAADLNDPAEGRLLVSNLEGAWRDLLPGLEGHVRSFAWQDADTIVYVADEGVLTAVGRIDADGSGRATLIPPGGAILGDLSLSRDGAVAAFVGSTPGHPGEVFVSSRGEAEPSRWTDSNPWLHELRLAPQEVVSYRARDGLTIEGILIRPLDADPAKAHPLVVIVHGGPESHVRNEWVTRYSTPGQLLAARGFAAFYPNYRGSTGRGVEFSKHGQADAAGAEFDDLVDGVDHLVKAGLVDRARVGVTGGSYGGYATAWCATALSERFAAGVMAVGISDRVSKFGTTDIPNEEYHVHARRWPWEDWDRSRERSPLYHVEDARTPILILHGKNDTRVHPGQSLALYRYLKVIDKAPVRLVLYPGEGHGNRMAAARLDFTLRQVGWFEHYLLGPGGAPPPHEVPEELECVRRDEDDDEDEDEDESEDEDGAEQEDGP